jgi:hypothetical protein
VGLLSKRKYLNWSGITPQKAKNKLEWDYSPKGWDYSPKRSGITPPKGAFRGVILLQFNILPFGE